jgi:hypothetical protein
MSGPECSRLETIAGERITNNGISTVLHGHDIGCEE